jgi:Protein of unknown function (DUF2585)
MLDGIVPPLLVLGLGGALGLIRHRFSAERANAPIATLVVALAIIALALFLELKMGRPTTYQHGPVRLWSGEIHSDQNSQQIFDPYSFTHVIHGALFYGLSRLILGKASFATALIATVTLEAAWEVYENTDQVVNRYRTETIALGYYGDSILNSFVDIVACVGGLLIAWRRPAWATLSWVVVVEVILAMWIRDNLTLNIIMLIHPVPAIKAWQAGV